MRFFSVPEKRGTLFVKPIFNPLNASEICLNFVFVNVSLKKDFAVVLKDLRSRDHQALPPPNASTPGTTKPLLHPPPPPPDRGPVKMNQTATVSHQKCHNSSSVKVAWVHLGYITFCIFNDEKNLHIYTFPFQLLVLVMSQAISLKLHFCSFVQSLHQFNGMIQCKFNKNGFIVLFVVPHVILRPLKPNNVVVVVVVVVIVVHPII